MSYGEENRMVLDGEWEPIPIKTMVRRDPEDEERYPFNEEPPDLILLDDEIAEDLEEDEYAE
jgi:hypothetical protein